MAMKAHMLKVRIFMILAAVVLALGPLAQNLKGQAAGTPCPASFTCDFEEGNLRGWTRTGTAFRNQPTLGDNPTARNKGQPSNHQGKWWIGTYENYQGRPGQAPGQVQYDGQRGTLTSARFVIPQGILTFLIGGGADPATRVELMVHDPIDGVDTRALQATGSITETMHRVQWDLTPYTGKTGFIRIVDDSSGGWGHINVDDFQFMGNFGQGHGAQTATPPGGATAEPTPVIVQPHPPIARIDPSFQSVPAGQSVTFRSQSEAGLGATMQHISWKGPGGQTAEGPEFSIDTQGLAARGYKISLLVINSAGLRDSATAQLVVTEREINVSLVASKTVVEAGEEVGFTALSNVSDQKPEYLFVFGGEQSSGWTQDRFAQHSFPDPGTYEVQVQVRLAGRTAASKLVAIVVKEEPPLHGVEDDHQRIDRPEAETTVTEGPVPPPPPEEIILGVEPNPSEPGTAVRLFARLRGQSEGAEYQFKVNETIIRDWAPDPEANHIFQEKGTYTAMAMMRAGDTPLLQSQPVTIRVESAIPPLVYAGLGLLAAFGAYIIWRIYKHHQELEGGRLPVRAIPQPDAGSQTLAVAASSGPLPAVSVRPVLDKGEQTIDSDDLLIPKRRE